MRRLLIQSCSATKCSADGPIPAIDLYDGYFYRIIDKAKREDRFDPNLDMLILSAEHGIITPTDEITPYDRRMDRDRAKELRERVQSALLEYTEDRTYSELWINGGKEYRRALSGIENHVDIPVNVIDGGGIGEKGSQLKQLISVE